MKKVTLVVTSDLVTDQRVHKIATTLSKNNYHVTVIGNEKKNSLPLLKNEYYETLRFRCWFKRGKLFYIEFQLRLFFILLFFNRFDIVHANDLDTLLPAFLACKMKRKKIIYDSHEYFTQTPELINRPITQKIWLYLEKFLVPKLKNALTVNDILAEIYQKKYGVNFHSIYNVPFKLSTPLQEKKEKILIYQGALNLGRGIELMIETMKLLPDWELWILGKGDIENQLKKLAENQRNIKFFGVIPHQELRNYTLQAKIGLSLEEDLGENYRVATPNKLFDYIQALVPVIVSDLPGLRFILEQHKVGFILKERTANGLSHLIKSLENIEKYRFFQLNCQKAAKIYCWENQEKKLLNIYENL